MKYVLDNKNEIVGSFEEVKYLSTYKSELINCDDNLIKFFELNNNIEEIIIGIHKYVNYKYEVKGSSIFIEYSYKITILTSITYLEPKIISYERNKKLNKLILKGFLIKE